MSFVDWVERPLTCAPEIAPEVLEGDPPLRFHSDGPALEVRCTPSPVKSSFTIDGDFGLAANSRVRAVAVLAQPEPRQPPRGPAG